jgi:hypothetical protein
MSMTKEYVKHAEECERHASACIGESNREIFTDVAVRWRRMAKHAAAPPENGWLRKNHSPDRTLSVRGRKKTFAQIGRAKGPRVDLSDIGR